MMTSKWRPLAVLRLCALFVAGAPLSAALAQNADAIPKSWRLSVAVGPAFALGKAAETWAKLVAERSGAAPPIKVHPGASLAQRDPDREFAALRDGAADLAVGSTLHWSAQVSELAVVGLPWLAPEPNALSSLATGPMRERLFEAITRAGAVPLALAPLGHRAIATQGRPVRLPDDMRGLKIRITASRYLVDFYAGLGALPFAMPFVEASERFRSGGLDAQEGSVATFAASRVDALGVHDVTLLDGVAELAVFAVNRATWDGWTESLRKVVAAAAEEAALELAKGAAAERDAALSTLKSRSMNLLRLTVSGRAAFAAAARPTYEKWSAVAGEELVRAAEIAVKAASTPP
jgi:TRAP-type C4-dicarboxylate transport system substrate-binding protein